MHADNNLFLMTRCIFLVKHMCELISVMLKNLQLALCVLCHVLGWCRIFVYCGIWTFSEISAKNCLLNNLGGLRHLLICTTCDWVIGQFINRVAKSHQEFIGYSLPIQIKFFVFI